LLVKNTVLLDTFLDEINYVVFDLETTGLNPLIDDEIIEIGAIKISKNFRILRKEKFQKLVKPEKEITDSSKKIHGITNENLDKSKNICEVLYDFIEYSSDCVLVAHDAPKDMLFIKSALRQYGMSNPFELVIDSLKISKTLNVFDKAHSLDKLIEKYNVRVNSGYKRHRALYDAEATAVVFVNMMKKIQAENRFTLIEFLEFLRR
jgi:DNA polymerase III epsilon subunit family exonuclease